jgi:3-oxoadipate enol-lactonase
VTWSGALALDDGGTGEPLVLLHGLATTSRIWSHVAPELRRTRRVIAVDVPGFGGSPAVGPGFDLQTVADHIADGLAARGVPAPYDLVGHSLGGGLALSIAAARPSDVHRLVLVAPAGLSRPLPGGLARLLGIGAHGALTVRRSLVPLTDFRWGRQALLAFAAADGGALAPTEARLLVAASAGARRTPAALAEIVGADLRPLLAHATMPLGVIWGAADRTIPPRAIDAIRAWRPDAVVSSIDGAGHIAMVERPREFLTAIEDLLAVLPRRATTFPT